MENSPADQEKKRKKGIRGFFRRMGKAVKRFKLSFGRDNKMASSKCNNPMDLKPNLSGLKGAVSTDPCPSGIELPINAVSSDSEQSCVPGPSGLHLKPDKDPSESGLNGPGTSDSSISVWSDVVHELTSLSEPVNQEVTPVPGPSSIEVVPDVDPADPESSSVSGPEVTPVAGPSGCAPAVEKKRKKNGILTFFRRIGKTIKQSALFSFDDNDRMDYQHWLSGLEWAYCQCPLGFELPNLEPYNPDPDSYGLFSNYYVLEKLLGSGSFGMVYEATRRSDGMKCAVKCVKKSGVKSFINLPEYSKPLYSEVAVNLVLRELPISPYIVQMLNWYEEPEKYLLVMEYPYPCKTLHDYILENGVSFDEMATRDLFRQLVLAAKHCVDRGVLHGDINMNNILVNTETLQLKLIDFSCSEIVEGQARQKYLATQTVWSLALVLLEIFARQRNIHIEVSKECHDLVTKCLHSEQNNITTLEQILEHDWLKQNSKTEEATESGSVEATESAVQRKEDDRNLHTNHHETDE